jgi:hypothetical protein
MVGSNIDRFNYGSDWYDQTIEAAFDVKDIDGVELFSFAHRGQSGSPVLQSG